MSETAKPEVGKRFYRRDGKVTGPIERYFGMGSYAYPFYDPKYNVIYTPQGKARTDVARKRSMKDLIKKYEKHEPKDTNK